MSKSCDGATLDKVDVEKAPTTVAKSTSHCSRSAEPCSASFEEFSSKRPIRIHDGPEPLP
jgi:hypothetical protein